MLYAVDKSYVPKLMSGRRMKSRYDGKIAGLYDLEESIGRGHYAVVKMARHVFTGERVAVKVIEKCRLDELSRSRLFQEVRCMKLVQHPNVVHLYEVIDTQTKLYLVMELGDGGDLYEYIMKWPSGLSEAEACFYFAQIVDAISYCHQLHVVHRDLKPENVVFFNNSKRVKVTDFGFSNCFTPGRNLDTSCGSLAYSAPEILLGDSYDGPAVDVWSLGVILYMLVCGKLPFQEANDSETLTRIMDCHYSMPEQASRSLADLLRGLLRRNPSERLTLKEISQHDWLNASHVPRYVPVPLISATVQSPATCRSTNSKPLTMLVRAGTLSDEEHAYIVQKMVDGKIASQDEIVVSLERDAYNHITATYFLLAERLLSKKNSTHADAGNKQQRHTIQHRSSLPNGLCTEEMSNGTSGKGSPISRKACDLLMEAICEDDSEETHSPKRKGDYSGNGCDEQKQCSDQHECSQSPSSGVRQCTASRSLHSVNSLPQLALNQISEEDEEEEENGSDDSVRTQNNDVSFTCSQGGGRTVQQAYDTADIEAVSFQGNLAKSRTARHANGCLGNSVVRQIKPRTSEIVQQPRREFCITSDTAKLRYKDKHAPLIEKDGSSAGFDFESKSSSCERLQFSTESVCSKFDLPSPAVISVSDGIDDDFDLLTGPQFLSRQCSMLQTSCSDSDYAVCSAAGSTNSLDRRLFQQSSKHAKGFMASSSRSIVGKVKKSVSMILGHLAVVGDIQSSKPRHIDTWNSCSNLTTQSPNTTPRTLTDLRQRVSGCQFARELRQNRSDHEALLQSELADRQQAGSSSRVIRFRSRDFNTLVTKFATGGT